jgi:hypothetical protein
VLLTQSYNTRNRHEVCKNFSSFKIFQNLKLFKVLFVVECKILCCFCVFVPHCRLSSARGSLLYYLEVNYHVYDCLSFGLFVIFTSRGVIEAVHDNAISF